MRIEKLILQNYKRLYLSNITYIEYEPNKPLQLIIGTNGCGKSSLISELSPLPADHRFYETPGKKQIFITHSGCRYELTCEFKEKENIYSFKKDDEELCLSRTITVYRELVKREFGMTEQIHELFLGVTSFCDMSPNDRKQWISDLSVFDFKYAYELYKKTSTALRDKQGSLKINQSRLTQETAKLMSIDVVSELKKQIIEHKKFLEWLLECKNTTHATKDDLKARIIETLNDARNKHTDLKNIIPEFRNYEGFRSKNDLINKNAEISINLLNLEKDRAELCELLENYDYNFEVLSSQNHDQSISDNVDYLVSERSNLLSQVNMELNFNDFTIANASFNTIYSALIDLSMQIKKCDQGSFDKPNIKNQLDLKNKLETELNRIKNLQEFALSEDKLLSEQLAHNTLTCPKCTHRWVKSCDAKKHDEIKKSLISFPDTIDDLEKKIIKIDEFLELAKEHVNGLKGFSEVIKKWPVLNPLWDYMQSRNIFKDTSVNLTYFISDTKHDLELLERISNIDKQLVELNNILTQFESNKERNISDLKNSYETNYTRLVSIDKRINELKKDKLRYEGYLKVYDSLIEHQLELKKVLSDKDILEDEYIQILINDYISKLVVIVKSEISRKEAMVSNNDSRMNVMDDIQSQIKDLTRSIDVLKATTKALSPTEGLIAKSLVDFINHLVSQMNTFISKIWLYPLELEYISIEDGVKLDYKFPFTVKNNGNIISDISKGSSSIKEIIDFSFKAVAAQYLGMEGYPLFLDELGSRFDPAHKISIVHIISELLESNDFDQIFMISHHITSYGNSNECDITVLDGVNLIMSDDSVYNQCVTIK